MYFQETHSDAKSEAMWKNEWNGECMLSHGDTNSRGTTILFKKSPALKINKVTHDIAGRYTIVTIEYNNQSITLVNVYAPNQDELSFL